MIHTLRHHLFYSQVSDFGLTVNTCAATHRYVEGGAKPIRYLAPEALRKGRYSEKSDVWAFGVTAWELLTNGDIPFWEIPNDEDVTRHFMNGGRLPPPDDKDLLDIWHSLQPCFAKYAADRPTFATLSINLYSTSNGGQQVPSSRNANGNLFRVTNVSNSFLANYVYLKLLICVAMIYYISRTYRLSLYADCG